jgi:hypothetical protein
MIVTCGRGGSGRYGGEAVSWGDGRPVLLVGGVVRQERGCLSSRERDPSPTPPDPSARDRGGEGGGSYLPPGGYGGIRSDR